MDVVRAQLQGLIEQNEKELQGSKKTSHFGDVMESPCAKKARTSFPSLWSKINHADLNAELFSPAAERIASSPFQRPWQPQKSPSINRTPLQIENDKLIAAVASPMRPRRSLGIDGFENDKVETLVKESFEAKLAAAAARSRSPFQRPWQPQPSPSINRTPLQIENDKFIAAVASPMRPRRSLGIDGFENDKVETLFKQSFEAKLAAAAASSVEAPPPKKPRTQDGCSGRSATPQEMRVTEPTQAGTPSLEGFWKSEDGVVCAKISGSDIKFSTGESERLERVAKKKVSLSMDGETHTGFVNDKDNVILWSDGDMWFFLGTSPPPGVFADSKQDGGVGADADAAADKTWIDEWVQAQWTSLTEPTQESNPKVDEKKKDVRPKAQSLGVIKKPLPLGPYQTTQTQGTQKKRLSIPASTVAWTPDDRMRLREKIQALLVETPTEARVETPTEARDMSPSSRSSSPRTSRSPSPRTSGRARLFHGSSSPQKRRDSIVPQPPPGSPGCDVFVPPPPPDSPPPSPGYDGVFVPPPPPDSPPPPPPESPTSDAVQTQQPCSTTQVRRSCVWPAMHLKIGPDSIEEIDTFQVFMRVAVGCTLSDSSCGARWAS